jgi:predicted nucleic acid-binding protein
LIVVDANIWIDHLRVANLALTGLIQRRRIVIHPYTIGEIALGSLAKRDEVLHQLAMLPTAPVADDLEILSFIERHALFGTGIGYVDSHLLASAKLVEAGKLWTRDKRLHAIAERMGIAFAA